MLENTVWTWSRWHWGATEIVCLFSLCFSSVSDTGVYEKGGKGKWIEWKVVRTGTQWLGREAYTRNGDSQDRGE